MSGAGTGPFASLFSSFIDNLIFDNCIFFSAWRSTFRFFFSFFLLFFSLSTSLTLSGFVMPELIIIDIVIVMKRPNIII